MSANLNVDRNLLFAVIALQDDLIDQTQFADVCAGWRCGSIGRFRIC